MSAFEPDVIKQFAAELAKLVRPSMPIDIALWDAETIGTYLNRDPVVVRQRYTVRPDFPKAIRLPSAKGLSHPLYKATEVIAWAESHQEKH